MEDIISFDTWMLPNLFSAHNSLPPHWFIAFIAEDTLSFYPQNNGVVYYI